MNPICPHNFTKYDLLREDCWGCNLRQECLQGLVTFESSNLTPFCSILPMRTEYDRLVSTCRGIILERGSRAERERILCMAEIGEEISNSDWYKKHSHGNQDKLLQLFKDIYLKSKTDGYACIQFYGQVIEKYPYEGIAVYNTCHSMTLEGSVERYVFDHETRLSKEAGKPIYLTWNKIKTQVLPKKQIEKAETCICDKCGKEHTKK